MLTPEAIRQITHGIRYKPNWTFAIRGDISPGVLVLVVTAMVPNADSPNHEIVPIRTNFPLLYDHLHDRVAYLRFVESCLIKAEVHEVHEWLKIHGHRVHNPHPERIHG